MADRVLILGEAPGPDGTGPPISKGRARFAGLARIDVDLLEDLFDWDNLLDRWPGFAPTGRGGSAFPKDRARRAAVARVLPARTILLGRRVAGAFLLASVPYFTWAPVPGRVGPRAVVIPHPSGSSRWWNEPVNRARAAGFLSDLIRKEAARAAGV